MTPEACEKFFKSSARSAGLRTYKAGKVSFLKPSALEIIAYVKPNFKVGLTLESIQNPNMKVACNCPQSKKGELCKHIWAAFLAVFEKSPNFFDSINEIIKKYSSVKMATPQPESQINSKAAFKLKQDAYRKEQYQKQKVRAKEFKNNKKKAFNEAPAFPNEVKAALTYFLKNGFSFENSLNENSIYLARKKLVRIFHPDIGGSHAEGVELNANSEVLLKYARKLA